MPFTDEEIAYLRSQRLARFATVAPSMQRDVVAVGYELDDVNFYLTGMNLVLTRKARNIAAGNNKVALLVDDYAAREPWAPRFVRVYGIADLVQRPESGHEFDIRITPAISWSWNLTGRPLAGQSASELRPRRTVHDAAS